MTFLNGVRQDLYSSPSFTSLLAIAAAIPVLYGVVLAVYRLYLSPLARFPGPKLAALTQYYEGYYDLVSGGGGNFTRRIKRMHEMYGPIVRINPYEIHIDDPEYYETIYAPGALSKWKWFENRFNMPLSTFSTADHKLHKPRRAALAPFFTTRKMQGHQPFLQSLVDRICDRFKQEYAGRDKPVVLNDVYGALSGDVITKLAFAKSYDLIGTKNWESPFTIAVSNLVTTSHFMTHFAWIIPTMNCIPDKLLMALSSKFKPIVMFRRVGAPTQPPLISLTNELQEMESQIANLLSGDDHEAKLASRKTVFAEIMNSKLPPHEISQHRLQNEAVSVVGAGFETTRWAMTVQSYFILANPAIHRRLRQELMSAIPDPDLIPAWSQLQQLPYLSACIEEGLRLSYGIVQRSPRVAQDQVFQYQGYTIPAGTPISLDHFHMHHCETIFPDSYTFKPERWLDNQKGPDGVKQLSRYMVAFSRGNRMCLGMQMAYLEMFVTIATLFRRFEMELFETDRSSVDFYRDYVTAQAKPGGLGVRVLVR